MACKDEYEVARLYSDGRFRAQLDATFEPGYTLEFHLAPPLLARRDPLTGHPQKQAFGPWLLGAFRWLARGKVLRGTLFDPFGWTAERRGERRLLADYERTLDELLRGLDRGNLALAAEIAALPEQIRGYGHVRARQLAAVQARADALLSAWRRPPAAHRAA